MVVYFKERFADFAVFAEGKGLLESQLLVEESGACEIRDADGDVGYPSQGRRRNLRRCQRGEQEEVQQASTEKPHSVLLEQFRNFVVRQKSRGVVFLEKKPRQRNSSLTSGHVMGVGHWVGAAIAALSACKV